MRKSSNVPSRPSRKKRRISGAAAILWFGLFPTIGFSQSKPPTPSAVKVSEPQQSKTQTPEKPPAADQRGSKNSPLVVEVLPPSNANEKAAAEADDSKQKAANDWHLVELTGILAAIGFFQLVVFGLQAHRLRQTIEAMENAERRTLRAYVGIEKIAFDIPGANDSSYTPAPIPLPAGFRFRDFLVVTVKNFGETPARDVTVFAYYTSMPPNERLPDNFFDQDSNNTDVLSNAPVRISVARYLLQRGQSEISKHGLTTITPLREAREGRGNNIYVFGRIYYRDAYGRPWRTKFCSQWEARHAGGARFVPYETYNDEDQNELLFE